MRKRKKKEEEEEVAKQHGKEEADIHNCKLKNNEQSRSDIKQHSTL